MMLSSNRRRQRSELRPHPKEEAMSHALATVRHDGRRPSVTPGTECGKNHKPRSGERQIDDDGFGCAPQTQSVAPSGLPGIVMPTTCG
jgi:hypothetical protein